MNAFQILKRPVITEKSLSLASTGKYTFEVSPKTRKEAIAKAVEQAFGVHVLDVRTINLKGKKRRSGPKRKATETSPTKKAIVRLAPGERMELFAAGENKGRA